MSISYSCFGEGQPLLRSWLASMAVPYYKGPLVSDPADKLLHKALSSVNIVL